MKPFFWMLSFLGMFLLFFISLESRQELMNTNAPAQNKNSALASAPVCLDRSYIPQEELHWLYMPNYPSELATSEYYGYLSGQLIITGAVDASSCPMNGLWPNGYANACGLEKTRDMSLYLQNVYDDEILAAGRGLGVPPIMIKQLIRYESQFWPAQMGPYHFGLGHLTYLGAMNAITWSRSLTLDMRKQLAPSTQITKEMMATQLIFTIDGTCPTCSPKVNVQKAEQSIIYIAETLLGYCRQTSQIVYNATNKEPGKIVDYATIWKLTLLNYNAGPACVYNAVHKSYQSDDRDARGKMIWADIATAVSTEACVRGVNSYVDNITGEYYDFGTSP